MWLLVSVSNNEIKYPILGDYKYIVGRQGCDIVIPDASVSRKQAILTMAHYESSVVKSYITPSLTLEDVSKFGTSVNGKAVKNPGGNTVTLKSNDEIKFGGTAVSVFKAVYEPFVATTSCLEKAPKKSLLKVMCLLGGHLVRDWRPICDLLIMSKINVTIKVICAINNQKHIVTPQYLDDLYSYMMGRCEKPNPVSYLPEVVDHEVPTGVSFHPDIRRMTLLKGLKFYFLSAMQFNKTNLAVSTAGGQPILLEDGTEEEAEAMTEDKTVVVAVSREVLATLSPSCQKFVRLVISVLKRKNLRMVTDPEIGWAILTCNTVDFCSAKSSITPDMFSYMAAQSMSQSTEVDKSQYLRPDNNRSTTTVQDEHTSLVEDIKPVTQIIKPEIFSPDSKKQPVKAEPMEESFGRKSTDTTEILHEDTPAKQPKEVPNSKISTLSNPSESLTEKLANTHSITEAVIVDNKDSVAKGIEGDNTVHNPVNERQGRFDDDDGDDDNPHETVSVFARRQGKSRARQVVRNLEEDSDDEESSKPQSLKRKPVDLFGDNDEFEVSLNKRKKTDKAERETNRETDSDVFSMITNNAGRSGSPQAKTMQHDPPYKHLVTESSEQGQSIAVSDNGSHSVEAQPHSDLSSDGWYNMKTAKSKKVNGLMTAQNGDGDIKPDMELLRDSEGKLLQNLCHVEVTELVARPAGSKVKAISSKASCQGPKNVKNFKKTKHAGAGRLPVIIGGRDLEVYLGSKHKDIDDLFSAGLAQENKRQDDERRERDLFNWDDRTRKTSTKRIR